MSTLSDLIGNDSNTSNEIGKQQDTNEELKKFNPLQVIQKKIAQINTAAP
jgi:hypothetical protein